MTTIDTIPIVDFKDVLSCTDLSTCAAVQELHSAFTTVGFVFIKNHGIKQELIDQVNSVGTEFFNKPREVKRKSLYNNKDKTKDTKHNGYLPLWTMGGSCVEAFDVCSVEECNFPDEDVPEFRPIMAEYYTEGMKLARLILTLMGHALTPEDPLFFVKRQVKMGEGRDHNYSAARVMRYPPLPPSFDFGKLEVDEDDQAVCRMGVHVDHGLLTLLFIDPIVGGLQVKKPNCNGWIDAEYVPGTVSVNLGILMEKWTGERYRATRHRVIIPKDETKRLLARLCCTVFVHPDADTVIESIDGSNKHPPFIAKEDTKRRLEHLSTCAAVQELHSAFTTVGFVFIKNHGIKQELIDQVNSVGTEFFNKPMEVKRKSLYKNKTKLKILNTMAGYLLLWTMGHDHNYSAARVMRYPPPSFDFGKLKVDKPFAEWRHRVIIPKDETKRLLGRLCCTVFVHPDADTVIESIDGSKKHPPFIAKEDTKRRLEYVTMTKWTS